MELVGRMALLQTVLYPAECYARAYMLSGEPIASLDSLSLLSTVSNDHYATVVRSDLQPVLLFHPSHGG